MITISITRYSFDELNAEAQYRAIENVRRQEEENFPQEFLSESMSEKAADLLFNRDLLGEDINLYYSLSYSQGDGVALHGEIFASEKPNLSLPENCYRVLITHSGRYYHEYSFKVELLDIDGEEIDGAEKVTQELRDICGELKRYGYKWQEKYFSDESMKDIAADMEYSFTEYGEIREAR